MYCCAQRRLFRAMQRLPRRYYTTEAIRFGTDCPDNVIDVPFTPKDGTELTVVHAVGVADGDPLPCTDIDPLTA